MPYKTSVAAGVIYGIIECLPNERASLAKPPVQDRPQVEFEELLFRRSTDVLMM